MFPFEDNDLYERRTTSWENDETLAVVLFLALLVSISMALPVEQEEPSSYVQTLESRLRLSSISAALPPCRSSPELRGRETADCETGVPASASSQPSHTITCSMFPWDDRGDGHPSDTTLLNTLAPVLVAHGLLTHGTTKLPLPATKRTKN
ncbi:hypothetical protein PoB_001086500 [Plakobranchus ocellatus]|uniref:Uncharacterized protein n=1 Tax=Plakobranchus ocellatus TaxID=259542 RepID=A0AAV3YNR4_9GAST|nr:hypothetical protein PoB_001086500 [Plakobranchus ocellatus]